LGASVSDSVVYVPGPGFFSIVEGRYTEEPGAVGASRPTCDFMEVEPRPRFSSPLALVPKPLRTSGPT